MLLVPKKTSALQKLLLVAMGAAESPPSASGLCAAALRVCMLLIFDLCLFERAQCQHSKGEERQHGKV